jgi:dynein heavy chain 1, cytosolic
VFYYYKINTQNNSLVGELKSEAIKERHWKSLMKAMNVEWNFNELNLGQVWKVDLNKYEAIIRETLLVAQGENGLEEYLKQVKI